MRSLVSIDGLDGSGKSQLARAVAAACEAESGEPLAVIRVDDFRRPLGEVPAGADEAAVYYDRYYDFAALDACLAAFLAGAPAARIPRFDTAREVVDGEHEIAFGAARLALLEGVFVLRARCAAAAPLVLLEVAEPVARARILARDMARGRPREVVEHRMNNRYFPAQRLYRAAHDPARCADVVIDNDQWERPRLVRKVTGRLPQVVEKVISRLVLP